MNQYNRALLECRAAMVAHVSVCTSINIPDSASLVVDYLVIDDLIISRIRNDKRAQTTESGITWKICSGRGLNFEYDSMVPNDSMLYLRIVQLTHPASMLYDDENIIAVMSIARSELIKLYGSSELRALIFFIIAGSFEQAILSELTDFIYIGIGNMLETSMNRIAATLEH